MSPNPLRSGRSPRSVAVIKLRYLGDVLLTTPVAEAVKRTWPETDVYFVVAKGSEPVLEGNPDIDDVLTIEQGNPKSVTTILKAVGILRKHRIDIALDLTGNDRSAFITRACGAGIRIGLHSGKPWRDAVTYGDIVPDPDPDSHQIDRNLSVLKVLGIEAPNAAPKLIVDPKSVDTIRKILAESGLGESAMAVLHPGARRWYKSWSAERFAELADRLASEGIKSVIAGGWEDRPVSDQITQSAGSSIINLSGRTTIPELAALCRTAKVFVGNDSGPLHIAAAVGTPTVSLFGLTNWKNWAPRGDRHVVLWRDCVCAPYGHKKECDQGPRRCMERIEVPEVFEEVIRLIDKIRAESSPRTINE